MNIVLNDKEIFIIQNYINEMLDLYTETDMINKDEPFYLDNNNIIIYENDLINLNNKLT